VSGFSDTCALVDPELAKLRPDWQKHKPFDADLGAWSWLGWMTRLGARLLTQARAKKHWIQI
jgi:hypothetical protein